LTKKSERANIVIVSSTGNNKKCYKEESKKLKNWRKKLQKNILKKMLTNVIKNVTINNVNKKERIAYGNKRLEMKKLQKIF